MEISEKGQSNLLLIIGEIEKKIGFYCRDIFFLYTFHAN